SSTIFEVEGGSLQLLNPAVLPSTGSSKRTSTYHFKSAELLAITASLELRAHTQGTTHFPEVVFGTSFPYRTPGDRAGDPCGFCLSADGFCSIQLKKRKGRDGTNQIDLDHSRCPNAGNLGLKNAAKASEARPCTNVPDYCPVSGCADVVWKYNLKSHLERIHPTANILSYESYYLVMSEERRALKVVSKMKPRKRSGKRVINFKITEAHGTQSALGNSLQFFPAPDPNSDDSDVDLPRISSLTDDSGNGGSSAAYASQTPFDSQPVARTDTMLLNINPERGVNATQLQPRRTAKAVALPTSYKTLSATTSSTADAVLDPDTTGNTDNPPMLTDGTSASHRSTRKPVKRKIVVSSDEEEDSEPEAETCADPECEETDSSEMVGCAGPACGSKVLSISSLGSDFTHIEFKFHLCCVGLKTAPPTEWFCDDECRANARGRRSRKKNRTS
ncbi:hypothetical protein B0H10DRAFT_2350756, partial [Mycena sp. CBHHK59/15]